MPWQVLASGAMLEVIVGEGVNGREITSTQICAEGQIIKGELSKGLVDRYDANDAYVRSLVQRVELSEDDEGNPVATPIGKPDVDATPSDKDDKATKKLKDALKTAQDALTEATTAKEAAEAKATELEAKPALDYNALSVEAVTAEYQKRGLTAEGTGNNGTVVKADMVTALAADDAAKAAA